MMKSLASMMLLGVLSTSALADPRFDVIDAGSVTAGMLVDHSTNLVWRSPSATYGLPLPSTPQIGDWRVATGQEVAALLPITFGQDQIVARDSDLFQALIFFAGHSTIVCGLQYGGCLGGLFVDQPNMGDHATYDALMGQFVATPYQADAPNVSYNATVTLGSYAQATCLPDMSLCKMGLFMVREVPEPGTVGLMTLGLAALVLMWRVRQR
jgi:hypothetical protein